MNKYSEVILGANQTDGHDFSDTKPIIPDDEAFLSDMAFEESLALPRLQTSKVLKDGETIELVNRIALLSGFIQAVQPISEDNTPFSDFSS